jgi:hypothetical protein
MWWRVLRLLLELTWPLLAAAGALWLVGGIVMGNTYALPPTEFEQRIHGSENELTIIVVITLLVCYGIAVVRIRRRGRRLSYQNKMRTQRREHPTHYSE